MKLSELIKSERIGAIDKYKGDPRCYEIDEEALNCAFHQGNPCLIEMVLGFNPPINEDTLNSLLLSQNDHYIDEIKKLEKFQKEPKSLTNEHTFNCAVLTESTRYQDIAKEYGAKESNISKKETLQYMQNKYGTVESLKGVKERIRIQPLELSSKTAETAQLDEDFVESDPNRMLQYLRKKKKAFSPAETIAHPSIDDSKINAATKEENTEENNSDTTSHERFF